MAKTSGAQAHRSSHLKQQNKQHKTGKHRSNRSLDNIHKGRVQLKVLSRRRPRDQKRHERRLLARQLRANKRQVATSRQRALGTAGTPPFLVALVSLHSDVTAEQALSQLTGGEADLTTTRSPQGVTHISVPRLKRRLAVLCPPGGDLYAVLDAAKVADCVLFLLGPAGADEAGTRLVSAVFAHGVSSSVHAVMGMEQLGVKRQSEAKKTIQKQLERWFSGRDSRLHALSSPADVSALLHHVINGKLRHLTFRERRPHLLAEKLQFVPDPEQAGYGTLSVSGYLRGRRQLSASRLVHVCGWGDFQMSEITGPADPHPLVLRQRTTIDQAMTETEERLLSRANPALQESLQSENVPNENMDGDEPWPDEDALADAETLNRVACRKKVPRGMSEYQAAWIIDSDGEEVGASGSDSDGMSCDDGHHAVPAAADDADSGSEGSSDADAATVSEAPVDDDKYDRCMDLDEEADTLHRIREERDDEQFPDEVDTPKETPARVRFAKYRGLASFRGSPWDPKENLPADYGRCFQFANFERARRTALSEETDGAQPGSYVTLRLLNVPSHLWLDRPPSAPLVLFGLLTHEQKMSVLNVVLQRHAAGHQPPIRNKQRLVFHVGFRRFAAAPIFSSHTNGDKHKMERYFRPDGRPIVATVFAPIVYGPAPVLVMQEDRLGNQDLVGTGSVLSVNPDRVVTKRVVLSGHPFKINKRSAVSRYMFFNREDILWFKPIELRTKGGRRGNIKEPLGTHGHMKAVFSGPLNSQDTIMMYLYKRVFPKWTYDPHVSPPPAAYNPERAALPTITEEAHEDVMAVD